MREYRITITLSNTERDALFRLAQVERRDTRAQAAMIIHDELARLGFLEPRPAQDANAKLDALTQERQQAREEMGKEVQGILSLKRKIESERQAGADIDFLLDDLAIAELNLGASKAKLKWLDQQISFVESTLRKA